LAHKRECYFLAVVTFLQYRTANVSLRTIPDLLKKGAANLRLRTKLLLSFVLLTSALSCVTLLMVRRNAQNHAQKEIEKDARNAALTVQLVQRQVQLGLSRRADLLASLALMRNGDMTTIDDASNDPWQSDDCNLFVLADGSGTLQALHVRGAPLSAEDAQRMLSRSVRRGETAGWWFGGRNLYQVVMQPFYADVEKKGRPQGYVVVGRLIDQRAVRDFERLSSSDVVFRYGDDVAVSTLPPLKESEFEKRARNHAAPSELTLDGERYATHTVELTPGALPAPTLTLLKSYAEVTAFLKALNHLLVGLGVATLLAGALLIFLISHTITQPLGTLVEGVKALEHGDFSYPLESAAGGDEASRLTRAFVDMRGTLQRNEAQREHLELQLRQAQKMEALGRLAGSVAHDFNNLLTVIRGHGELMLDRVQAKEPLFHNAQQICKTADRATSLTRQLLTFSRRQVLQPKVVDVNELITDMGKLLRRLVREDIELNLQLGDSLGHVKADPGQLEQVLLNLVVNAGDAMPAGGTLTIATENAFVDYEYRENRPSVEPGNYVLLSVSDTGKGMDPTIKAHIFEPFFTTKEPGKGTGLGLATVYGVVEQSGGSIWVDSEPGRGTRFEIYLPYTEEATEAAGNGDGKGSAAFKVRRKTILVVEDEPDVRELACEFLTSAGYRVLTAEDGCEGLQTIERLGGCIEAVLTDVVMPRMRGPELGRRLKTIRPNVKIIYMTGYLEQIEAESAVLEEATILQKPFSREAVVRHVSQALNGKHPKKSTTPALTA
jgi:signal transduction histidine kinase/CheY-like chemotaxis protein